MRFVPVRAEEVANRGRRRRAGVSLVAGLTVAAAFAGLAVSGSAAGEGSVSPKPGLYSGTAGVDLVHLKVSAGGSSIANLNTTFNLAVLCGIPSGTAHERFPTMAIRNRHFKGSIAIDHSGSTEHLSVQGRIVSATRIAGKLSGHFTIRSLPPCHGSSTFSAKRKGK